MLDNQVVTPDGARETRQNNAIPRKVPELEGISSQGLAGAGSKRFFGTEAPEMKNPGALAGATGADHSKYVYKTMEYKLRAMRATELATAIGECHPEDACVLMTAALCDLTPEGAPWTYFASVEDDARWWSRLATPAQLMAMMTAALDCLGDHPMHRNMRKRLIVRLFESLPEDDRRAFLRRTDPTGRFQRRAAQ